MTFPETYFLKLTPHYAENCKEKTPQFLLLFLFTSETTDICPKYTLLIIILSVF